MRDITVLLTAAGAPGTAALLRALRMNGERGVRVIGIDMSPQAIGRHFCDRFFVVPPGSDPAFPEAVLNIVRRENVDIVLPQSSFDLQALADAKERFLGTAVLVSSPQTTILRCMAPTGCASRLSTMPCSSPFLLRSASTLRIDDA